MAAIAMLLPACESVGLHGGAGVTIGSAPSHQGHGPPPHAPAHGYRHKHKHKNHDLELEYDSGLGVYAVLGHDGYYFQGDFFYRMDGSAWRVSANFDGPWEPAHDDRLPRGLKKHSKGKGKSQGRDDHQGDQGKGNGKGKDKGRGNS